MASFEEIRDVRIKKAELLRSKGINPYPNKSHRTHEIGQVIAQGAELEASQAPVTITGRIMSLRPQGVLVFGTLYDGTGRFQFLIKKGEGVSDEQFDLFAETVDIGDFIDVTGPVFTTKRGEKTVQVSTWAIVTKAIAPLPDKLHGIQEVDDKLRKRYLDILFNDDVRDLFVKRAKFWSATRSFLAERGFLEVETPVLENTTGGADARPFKTHHNALDIDVYLRISCGELWQKKMLVAGYPKVFEIGRIFRNEGMSAEHLQDYTQLEFYWGYANFEDGMKLVEDMYKYVAQETFGTLEFTIGNHQVNLGAPWKRYDYTTTIKEMTGVDITTASLADIEATLKKLDVQHDRAPGWNVSRATDQLWKYCRKQISGPGFLIGVPKELSPLAKSSPDNPTITERFQPLIAGSELGNGYSELNDPIDQNNRFLEQQKLRDAGDEEAQMKDDDFVEALEYGMPPACGFGMSERVFAFLANKPVRETQVFPLMRPKN